MLRALFRSRDRPRSRWIDGPVFPWGGTSAGKLVNEQTAMTVTAVYACVRILAEAVAGLPVHLYRPEEDDDNVNDCERRVHRAVHSVNEREFANSRSNSRRVKNHPLFRVLHHEPNPEMTAFVFRETLMAHLLLWGNAYAQIIRNGWGRPVALYPLLPNRMTVDRDQTGQIVYTYIDDDGKQVTLRHEEVLHIPGLGFDGLVGYSPIAMAKNAVGLALATEEYGATFFANGANPGGVLEHPGVVKNPDQLRESWYGQFGGSGKAHKIAVLEEGLKFHAIGIPPEAAQFLQTRKFQINEIARIFRVPPHMVGDLDKSSFSNIEQQSLEFVKYSIGPWIVRWEQALMQALLLPSEKRSGMFIRFNLDGLLRGDYQSRMKGYATGRQNGWLSANDIRELEDMNRIPAEEGGDDYLVNGNMKKIREEQQNE